MSMESFSVKDECGLDLVQYQHRSFDQVSLVIRLRSILLTVRQYLCRRLADIRKHWRVARVIAC